jgi:hypothetical protein
VILFLACLAIFLAYLILMLKMQGCGSVLEVVGELVLGGGICVLPVFLSN